jgi:triosephosphate isomerase
MKMTIKHKQGKPFFEIGPKTYIYGQEAVELALAADVCSKKYDVDIIFTAQYTDIEAISHKVRYIKVYAQHMDPIYPGKGIGAVLPEAIKYAGADGVMLNHAERPLSKKVLAATIERAKEVGLETIVCANTPEDGYSIAEMVPNIVLVESPLLIGKGKRTPEEIQEIKKINEAIYQIDPQVRVMHAAGISDENDVYEIIAAGADATGSTSGIMKAVDRADMMERMVKAVRDAWNATR